MIRTSEQITELSDAMVKAQGKFGAAIKSSQNPAFRSKYADLSSVIEATLEHLNAEGIAVLQHPWLEYKAAGEGSEAYITVTTRLQHKSGQFMESDLSIPAIQRDRFDAQSCGSAMTYACRYALQSICCVPREDDDGNQAVGRGSTEAAQAVAKVKIADLEKKKAANGSNAVPCLFYAWSDESQTAEVSGDRDLMKAHWKALKPFWNGNSQSVVMNAQVLEDMKFYFQDKGVEFRALKAANA